MLRFFTRWLLLILLCSAGYAHAQTDGEPSTAEVEEKIIRQLNEEVFRLEREINDTKELNLRRYEIIDQRLDRSTVHTDRIILIFAVAVLLAFLLFAMRFKVAQQLSQEKIAHATTEARHLMRDIERELARPELEYLRVSQLLRQLLRRLRSADSRMTMSKQTVDEVRKACSDPFLPTALHFIARVLEAEYDEKWNLALQMLEQLREMDAKDPDVLIHLSHVHKNIATQSNSVKVRNRHQRLSYEFYAQFTAVMKSDDVSDILTLPSIKTVQTVAEKTETQEAPAPKAITHRITPAPPPPKDEVPAPATQPLKETTDKPAPPPPTAVEPVAPTAPATKTKTATVKTAPAKLTPPAEAATTPPPDKTDQADKPATATPPPTAPVTAATTVTPKPKPAAAQVKPAATPPPVAIAAAPAKPDNVVKDKKPTAVIKRQPSPAGAPSPVKQSILKTVASSKTMLKSGMGGLKNLSQSTLQKTPKLLSALRGGNEGELPFLPVPNVSEVPKNGTPADIAMWQLIRRADLFMQKAAAATSMRERNNLIDKAINTYTQAQAQAPKTNVVLYQNWGVTLLAKALHINEKKRPPIIDAAIDKFMAGNVIKPHFFDFHIASVYAIVGKAEECRKWLEISKDNNALDVEALKTAPDFDKVRHETWFDHFLNQ